MLPCKTMNTRQAQSSSDPVRISFKASALIGHGKHRSFQATVIKDSLLPVIHRNGNPGNDCGTARRDLIGQSELCDKLHAACSLWKGGMNTRYNERFNTHP
ncbi:UNVERIFIED_CONTAM: hypothetical protein FKN15_064237 [Acipenser sinensis]